MIRYTISKDRTTLIRPWRVHMLDIDAGTITLIAMRQTWATCCSWLQRRIAAAGQPEVATRTCPACSRPSTSIRDHGDGPTVARKWLPCGCTRIVPAGGDRD